MAAERSGKEGRDIWNLLSSQWLVVWDYARFLVLPEPCLQIRPPVSDTTTKDAQDNRSGIYRARQLVICTTTTTRIPLLLAAISAASTLLRLKSTGITRNFVSHVVSTERHRSPIPEPRPSFQRPTRRLPPRNFAPKCSRQSLIRKEEGIRKINLFGKLLGSQEWKRWPVPVADLAANQSLGTQLGQSGLLVGSRGVSGPTPVRSLIFARSAY